MQVVKSELYKLNVSRFVATMTTRMSHERLGHKKNQSINASIVNFQHRFYYIYYFAHIRRLIITIYNVQLYENREKTENVHTDNERIHQVATGIQRTEGRKRKAERTCE